MGVGEFFKIQIKFSPTRRKLITEFFPFFFRVFFATTTFLLRGTFSTFNNPLAAPQTNFSHPSHMIFPSTKIQ